MNLMADSTDIDLLKRERTFVETRMELFISANEQLCEALKDDLDARREVWTKFESFKHEHSDALKGSGHSASQRVMQAMRVVRAIQIK